MDVESNVEPNVNFDNYLCNCKVCSFHFLYHQQVLFTFLRYLRRLYNPEFDFVAGQRRIEQPTSTITVRIEHDDGFHPKLFFIILHYHRKRRQSRTLSIFITMVNLNELAWKTY